MRRTYEFIISLIILLSSGSLKAQDTIQFPLKIRAGFDLVGPSVYYSDKSNQNFEGYISIDKSERMSYVVEGGYLNYKYSQYNYEYLSKGIYTRFGVDFNLLKPGLSAGKYYVVAGLRYGLSFFNSETPSFSYGNYWGEVTSSIPGKTNVGHFLEFAPGVRTSLTKHVSIGWTVRIKMLVSGGNDTNLRPIYFPGYGTGSNKVNAGANFFLVWNFPFRTKTVITKPDVQEEPEEPEEPEQNQ